jgi:hypothetical protein
MQLRKACPFKYLRTFKQELLRGWFFIRPKLFTTTNGTVAQQVERSDRVERCIVLEVGGSIPP